MPRIISGSAGSIPLATPKGLKTRPTSDKVKEALFSILSTYLPVDNFLDLFAGSGQIGLEAASRGCQHVVMIEKAAASLACISKNVEKTRLTESVEIIRGDVRRQVNALAGQSVLFDLIFMDPPYDQAVRHLVDLAPDLSALMQPDALLILEHDAKDEAPLFVTNLQRSRRCQYGTAMLSFYQLDKDRIRTDG